MFSFFSLFLALKGFSDYQVGELMGIVPLVMVIATPIIGLIDDGSKREKILLVSCNILIALVPLILLYPSISYVVMAVLIVFMSIIRAPITPAMDSLTTVIAHNNGKRFSDIRVFASISYALLMAFGGLLIDKVGFDFVIILCSTLTFVTAIIIMSLPVQQKPSESKGKLNLKSVFQSRSYIAFIIINVLTWAVWSASYNFEGVYFAEKFASASVFGYVESLRVVFEVVAMLYLTKAKRPTSIKTLYLFFAVTAVVKYIIYYFNLPAYTLFVLAPFMGASFGGILFCYVEHISKLVPKHNIHTAIFAITSAQMLFNAGCTYVGSAIVKYFGFYNVYLLFTAITLCGLVLIVFSKMETQNQ